MNENAVDRNTVYIYIRTRVCVRDDNIIYSIRFVNETHDHLAFPPVPRVILYIHLYAILLHISCYNIMRVCVSFFFFTSTPTVLFLNITSEIFFG